MPSEETEVVVVGAGQAGVAVSEHLGPTASRTSSWSGTASPSAGARSGGTPSSRTARRGTTGSRGWSSPTSTRRLRLEGPGRGLLRRLRREDRRPGPVRRRGDLGAQEHRPPGLPRRDVAGPRRRPLRRGRDRAVPAARDTPVVPDGAVPCSSTPAGTATPGSCPTARCSWSGPAPRGADRRRAAPVRPPGLPLRRPHERPPRRYRGRDFCWWLGVLGLWDADTPPRAPTTSPSRSAAPAAATPSTSAPWPAPASNSSG